MRQTSHSDRLKAFSSLIEPIARLLESEKKVKPATTPSPEQQAAGSSAKSPSDSKPSSSSLSRDSGRGHEDDSGDDQGSASGFFHPKHDPDASKPMSLPMPLGGAGAFAEHATNRRYELVRQEMIQFQHEQFALQPSKMQMMAKLGGLLYSERMNLKERAYHFVCNGQLVGMLDRKRERLYVRQEAPTQDFSDLHCIARPDAAVQEMAGFARAQLQDCVWLYAAHDPEALLDVPFEAGTHLMRLRRLPKVSPHLLADSQMILIRQLLIRPQGFDQLSPNFSRSLFRNLMRDLACMLLTRSLEFTTVAPPAGTPRQVKYRVVTR
jgi:hypothetical protein